MPAVVESCYYIFDTLYVGVPRQSLTHVAAQLMLASALDEYAPTFFAFIDLYTLLRLLLRVLPAPPFFSATAVPRYFFPLYQAARRALVPAASSRRSSFP